MSYNCWYLIIIKKHLKYLFWDFFLINDLFQITQPGDLTQLNLTGLGKKLD